MMNDEFRRIKYERRQTAISLSILVVLLFFGCYSIYQRSVNTADIKQTTLMQRSMLNARARVQVILIVAQMEDRKLTTSETDEIQSLWKTAQYDQAVAAEDK